MVLFGPRRQFLPFFFFLFYLPFAHFPPHWPLVPAATILLPFFLFHHVETSGANANETDLICAIPWMTHILLLPLQW
jgi:hypothetical protein